MKKTFLLFVVYSTFVAFASAQATINFQKMYHDFGEIAEGDQASYSFEVVNSGNSPLIISKVQPSCGCTTPDWTKEPILPNTKGTVTASYGTKGRPGSFNKSISVLSNDPEKPNTTIFIKGFVSNVAKPTYTNEQLKISPKIVIEKTMHNFGTVEKNTKIPFKLSVSNLGRSDLKISEITSACNCVQLSLKPEFIKTGESGFLQLLYAPNSIGVVSDVVNIKSNDLTNSTFKFSFAGKVVENINTPSMMKESNSFVPFK
ncbi:MAG: DUF1573 domain-containing protein [Cytophagales bacterium]